MSQMLILRLYRLKGGHFYPTTRKIAVRLEALLFDSVYLNTAYLELDLKKPHSALEVFNARKHEDGVLIVCPVSGFVGLSLKHGSFVAL